MEEFLDFEEFSPQESNFFICPDVSKPVQSELQQFIESILNRKKNEWSKVNEKSNFHFVQLVTQISEGQLLFYTSGSDNFVTFNHEKRLSDEDVLESCRGSV